MSTTSRFRSPSRKAGEAFFVLLLIAVVSAPALATSPPVGPLATVKQLVARVFDILNDKQASQDQKQKRLHDLGSTSFEFGEMSRSALGSAWRGLNSDQRQRFTTGFTAFIQDAYISKLQNYSGQQVEILKAHTSERDYAQVSGRIVQKGTDPITLSFSLKRAAKSWKITDVAVDNVSTLEGYRTEFQRILREKGFDQLMAQIQQRDRELASSLGGPPGLPF